MPRAASDSRSARPSSSLPATPTGSGIPAERADVGGRVSRAARQPFLPAKAEDEHRRFPADALGVAVDEAVEDVVAGDDDPAAGEARNERLQAAARDVEGHCRGL